MNRQAAICNTPRSSMTLLEVLVFIAMLLVGLLGASWVARQIGWPGYPLGFVGGFLIIPGLMFGVGSLVFVIWPDRPRCRNRKCKAYDFELDTIEGESVWLCRCGIRYRKVGRRFREVPASPGSD
jgi:hypothetical protein